MFKKLKPVVDLPRGSDGKRGWVGFHFEESATPPGAMTQEGAALLSMEDVIACLGFTTADQPLAKVAQYPKILDAMSHLAEKRTLDSITPEQKDAADKLMEIMKGEDLEAAEAAAQLLAMVAADDTKNPHLLYVDRWITTCCSILRRCRPGVGTTEGKWSEALVGCAASCLADLGNNPRSTILCSTRASEIFQCLQHVLLLNEAQNRMVYFQACRGLAEVLHPSTWPMNEVARVPKRLIQRLHELLSLEPQQPLSADGAPAAEEGAAPPTPPVSEDREGTSADASAAAAGGGGAADGADGGAEEAVEAPVTQEDLIRSQACKVVQFMATSGAAELLLENEPAIVQDLEKVRSTSTVEEVVLEADSALMSLWLSPKGFSTSDPSLRQVIAENLLRALGSEDLMDNHQDCSLALVTATMNPQKGIRDEALALFGATLEANPDLVPILIGHVEDGDSLAHQSVVYFMLHLLEAETPLAILISCPEHAAMLVASLVATACNERHYAPITALIRLVYHPVSRRRVLSLLTPPVIQKLRGIPGGRIQKEVDSLMKAIVSTEKDPSVTSPSSAEPIDLAAAYREDPSLQSMFFRKLVVSKSTKNLAFKRTKSASDAEPEEGEGSGSATSLVV